MDPWDLLHAHRYQEALARTNPARGSDFHKHSAFLVRGIALLCLGRFSEAVVAFEAASQLRRQDKFKVPPFLNELGTALWLTGNKVVAKEIWRASVDGVRHGTIHYGDAGGGVEQGLLLWYGGVSTSDRNTTLHALDYLERLSKKKRWAGLWPRPLAHFALGKKSFDDVLREDLKCADLKEAIQRTKEDFLLKRQLAQALLCFGTSLRAEGDRKGCRNPFRECAKLENPIIETAWYLAAAEVGQLPRQQN